MRTVYRLYTDLCEIMAGDKFSSGRNLEKKELLSGLTANKIQELYFNKYFFQSPNDYVDFETEAEAKEAAENVDCWTRLVTSPVPFIHCLITYVGEIEITEDEDEEIEEDVGLSYFKCKPYEP